MKSQDIDQYLEKAVENYLFNCPHCKGKTHMKSLFFNSFIEYTEYKNIITYYVVFQCVPCNKLTLKTCNFSSYKTVNDFQFDWRNGQYPTIEITEINDFDWYVPNDIIIDFKEAIKCFEIDAYKACVAMCRRSLQSVMIEKNANQNKDLNDQINEIQILQDIKDWAHEIRHFGNRWAHPNKDWLKEVTKEEAKEVIDFMKQFFNYVYVMPKKVEISKIKREEKSKKQ